MFGLFKRRPRFTDGFLVQDKYWEFYHLVNKKIKFFRDNPKIPCNPKNDIDSQTWAFAHKVFKKDKLGYY